MDMTEEQYRNMCIENCTRLVAEFAATICQGIREGEIFLAAVASEELVKFLVESPIYTAILSHLAQDSYHNQAQMDQAIKLAREEVAKIYKDMMGDMERDL